MYLVLNAVYMNEEKSMFAYINQLFVPHKFEIKLNLGKKFLNELKRKWRCKSVYVVSTRNKFICNI